MAKRTKQDELELALKELGAKHVKPLPRVEPLPTRRKKKRRRHHDDAKPPNATPPRLWAWLALGFVVLVIAVVGIGYYPLQTIAACAVIALFGGVVIHRR